jgi:hypothetical protein
MNRRAGLIFALMILAGASVRAQSLAFDATTVGGPASGMRAELSCRKPKRTRNFDMANSAFHAVLQALTRRARNSAPNCRL